MDPREVLSSQVRRAFASHDPPTTPTSSADPGSAQRHRLPPMDQAGSTRRSCSLVSLAAEGPGPALCAPTRAALRAFLLGRVALLPGCEQWRGRRRRPEGIRWGVSRRSRVSRRATSPGMRRSGKAVDGLSTRRMQEPRSSRSTTAAPSVRIHASNEGIPGAAPAGIPCNAASRSSGEGHSHGRSWSSRPRWCRVDGPGGQEGAGAHRVGPAEVAAAAEVAGVELGQ